MLVDHDKQLEVNKNLQAENEHLKKKMKHNEKIFIGLENLLNSNSEATEQNLELFTIGLSSNHEEKF